MPPQNRLATSQEAKHRQYALPLLTELGFEHQLKPERSQNQLQAQRETKVAQKQNNPSLFCLNSEMKALPADETSDSDDSLSQVKKNCMKRIEPH